MHWNSTENSKQLANDLAMAVASKLIGAIAERGRALLAVSGGSTPKRFMQALSRQDLDWQKITVVLVDERWVPADHPRSNAALVQANLLQGPAAQARFVPLYAVADTPEQGLAQVQAGIQALPLPLDVVVLGMGEDGHTASFFPGGDHLAQALDPRGMAPVLPMRAPGADEPRITLTLPLLAEAHAIFLLIEGDAKRKVLIEAVHGADLPIAAMIQATPDMQTYWCP